MASVLLSKIIIGEISPITFVKWLQDITLEDDKDYEKIMKQNITCGDFVTYFINFLHEIPRDRNSDTSQSHNNDDRKKDIVQSEADSTHNISITEEKKHDNSLTNSTPKSNFNKTALETDYVSAISPLYQQKNSYSNGTRKSSDKFSLCLGDFLTNNSQNLKKKRVSTETLNKKKESRRIKPTSLCVQKCNNGFQSKENSFNFQANRSEVDVKTSIEQRNLLIEEKDKILLTCEGEKNIPSLIKRQNSIKEKVIPTLARVTHKKEIENLVIIYKFVLNSKFIINVTSEIYFMLSLLLTQHINSKKCYNLCQTDQSLGVDLLDKSDKNRSIYQAHIDNFYLFESVHNIVYFAGKCLETQLQIIKYYDKSTLQLLGNNKYIQQLFPQFSKKILQIADNKVEKAYNEIITPIIPNNVCFNIDTDNKENFSNQQTFHAFRKQRDLFYEILRIWENNHLLAGWSYSTGLAGKIRSLFSLNTEPICYIHFARLFKNQLLTNCLKGPKEKGLSENNLTFLPSLPIDVNKLNQLTNRLVTKETSNGINSLPEFTGHQEFYRDFIVVASNHSFNKHLCDNLISEIIEINNATFWETDLEKEKDVDINTRKQYVSYIKNLRILAKFLGYIESMPYKSVALNLSAQVMDIQIKVRSRISPEFDVKGLLETAVSRKTLILIIPWLTKYLSMLDKVTLRLPYYSSLNQMLFEIYASVMFTNEINYNTAVIKFCLGWLFELPHFPDTQYFNFCLENRNYLPTVLKTNHISLDDLNIISQSVLYVCCPYLEEIKKALVTTALDDKVSIKYITPVTAIDSKIEATRKKMQHQLEEAFFNSHPLSVRKTVEFVSERVASVIVKHICYDMVVMAKLDMVQNFKGILLKEECKEKQDIMERKTTLKKQAITLAHNSLEQFMKLCDNEVSNITKVKITGSIENLLPLDTLTEMKEVCVDFSIKMCIERVRQWLATHVTYTVFLKDLEIELQKFICSKKTDKISPVLPLGGKSCNHDEKELSSVTIMERIKEFCCDLIENKNISPEDILKLLEQIHHSLTGRNDINDHMALTIHTSLFDLCLILVSRQSTIFNNEQTLNHFENIWKLQSPTQNTIFNNLFCPRNIRILQDSLDKDKSWKCYAKVVFYLLDKKFLDEKDLEYQCTSFYNRNWDEPTLVNFSNFLKLFLNHSGIDSVNSFAMLLEFLSDYCSDL
ncbi:codanin-1 like protein dlt [Rhynchophorus ferrugineus]|uniref:codanin-1 like protein dlt n=1 Tax=Rhynchophorus ferrugineus TaxID=354439 RepID=UPI003FCD4346